MWKEFTEHDFVEGLGDGTLPLERFKEYLIQDYLYLVRFLDFSDVARPLTCCVRHTLREATHWPPTRRKTWNQSLRYNSPSLAQTSKNFLALTKQSAKIVMHINTEMALHINYCASFGLTKEEMEQTPEKQGTSLYSLPFPFSFPHPYTEKENRSLHRLQPLHSRHWPVAGLARAAGRACSMPDRLRHDRQATLREIQALRH